MPDRIHGRRGHGGGPPRGATPPAGAGKRPDGTPRDGTSPATAGKPAGTALRKTGSLPAGSGLTPPPGTTPARATPLRDPSLRRSLALFRAFRREQADPAHFYGILARDAAEQIDRLQPLRGSVVVDVGGGSGYFTREFRSRGADAYLFEYDQRELTAGGGQPSGAVLADGYLLPLADGAADIAFSSNVLEHVDDPQTFLSELIRVTRPGGLIYVSFTNWLSPWGGHETSPWHYLGAERARARYRRRTGRDAKHTLGENLFVLHIGPLLKSVRARADVRVVSARSRYWPFLAEAVTRVPVLREFATWNLLLILRRCP